MRQLPVEHFPALRVACAKRQPRVPGTWFQFPADEQRPECREGKQQEEGDNSPQKFPDLAMPWQSMLAQRRPIIMLDSNIMIAFAMSPAEIVVILVVSVLVAAVVAAGLALVFALGRKSSKPRDAKPGSAAARLRELDGLRENGQITEEEHRKLRAGVLESI